MEGDALPAARPSGRRGRLYAGGHWAVTGVRVADHAARHPGTGGDAAARTRAGRAERARARALLECELLAPGSLSRQETMLARVFAPIRDGSAWRATAYFALMLPTGIVTFTVAVTWWAAALWLLTLPAWAWALPARRSEDHRHLLVEPPMAARALARGGATADRGGSARHPRCDLPRPRTADAFAPLSRLRKRTRSGTPAVIRPNVASSSEGSVSPWRGPPRLHAPRVSEALASC